MENLNLVKPEKVQNIINKFCYTIGMIPSSYKVSLTYEEQIIAIGQYLEETVIPALNNNAEAVAELQSLFVQLKNYVENYFDNLDVQQEINNKLDQMTENGQLQEIITSYINVNGILAFNTVNDMKNSTNLVNGSFASTSGYYNINDGGKAQYKIRQITNEDIIDNGSIIGISDTLVAELIISGNINVKQFGAYGDNNHDDTNAINKMIEKCGYAYLTSGIYKTSSSIILDKEQSIYGENLNNTKIKYTGSSECIKNKDVNTCIEIAIHDLTIEGTNKTGKGVYLYRSAKQGDAYHQIYNLKISGFEYGIYAGQYQNETKFNNLYITNNKYGIYFYYLNDCYVSDVVSCINEKDGLYIQGSSEIRFTNIKSWYNGSSDPENCSNINIRTSVALNFINITSQESYGHNLILFYCKNVMINNCYLSWPGLNKSNNIYQVFLEENINCSINATTQNGHYGESGYSNYILALKNHPYGCDINIKTESDFPKNQKMILIEANNNANSVFTRNNFNIMVDTLKINKSINYAINGNLANKNNLSFVNNNSVCSFNEGKLRIDTTNKESNTTIYFHTAKLPREDFYTSYIRFKKVSGTGTIVFDNPAYADISNVDVGTELFISYSKYINNLDNYVIGAYIKPNQIIDVEEFGLTIGESGQFNNSMDINAII